MTDATVTGEHPRHAIRALAAHTLASRLVIYASGALSAVIIARALGPDGRGLYYLPVTMGLIAASVASMGVEQAQFRLWGLFSRGEFATAAVCLSLALGVAGTGLMWLVWALGNDGAFAELSAGQMAMVASLLPVWVHVLLVRSLLTMDGGLRRTNVASIVGDMTRTLAIVALWATVGLTVDRVLALFACTIVIPWLVMVASPSRPLQLRRPLPLSLIRSELRLGGLFSPYFLFLFLTLRVDVLLVGGLGSAEAVGLYSIAVLFAELVWIATEALRYAIKERQANAPRQEAIEVSARCIRMSLLAVAIIGAALAAAAPVAIPLVFGDGFEGAVGAVWLLLPASGAMAVWRVAGVALNRFERPWLSPAAGLVAIASNLGLNVLSIPPLGIEGAALASLVSYGLGGALTAVLLACAGGLPRRSLLPRADDVRDLARALRSPLGA